MATKSSNKTIEFVRIGNPWLVGKNVNRVVPVYAVHNILAPDFDRDNALQSIKDSAFDAAKGLKGGLHHRVKLHEHEYVDLQQTVFGLLAPERRIFRDTKNGGANSLSGALFPLVAGLVTPTASDDGLGRRMRELLERYKGDWQSRLLELLAPTSAKDPATGFAMTLLGGVAGRQNPRAIAPPEKQLLGLDKACAEFVDRLIVKAQDASRIAAIRNLAFGVYAVSVIRMVAGPVVANSKKLPLVFAYGGLPPGRQGDPLVRASCKSFQSWIRASWQATADLLSMGIGGAAHLPQATGGDKLRQQINGLLRVRLGNREKDIESVLSSLKRRIDDHRFGPNWCREALESKAIGFKKSELARRVRSLGGNIGLTGPDRGSGSPRLVLDTPLLGVLVRGVVGIGHMEFERFISELAERFGLVLGLGDDDSIADRIEAIGSDGYDAYEILKRNQDLLRERLLRAGMARAYSDSHTEVYNDA